MPAAIRSPTSDAPKGAPTFAEAAVLVLVRSRSARLAPSETRTGLLRRAYRGSCSLGSAAAPSPKSGAPTSLAVLAPISHEKPEAARRVRHRVAAVMHWAVAMEYRPDNPCERVAATLRRQQRVVRHMRALPHAEVAEAVATVRASGATTAAKLAFEFLCC